MLWITTDLTQLTWLELAVYGLATWRLSYLLVMEDGPLGVCELFRQITGVRDEGGVVSAPAWNPLMCVYCTSVWMAVLMLVCPPVLAVVCALSAIAVMIQQFTRMRAIR